MKMNEISFKSFIVEEQSGKRLDVVVNEWLNDLSRNNVQNLISDSCILLNDTNAKASTKVNKGDVIKYFPQESVELSIEKENIPLNIVYEDEYLLIINKPKNMVVHPSNGHNSGTLVNALLYHIKDLSDFNGVTRPGIVHRIDKDTSGLLVVAKDNKTHNLLSDLLKDHNIKREYYALVKGIIYEDDAKIVAPIGRDKSNRQKMCVDLRNGKNAVTYLNVVERFNHHTLVKLSLETGRTHQIRVHLNYIGHPVIGDLVYGSGNRDICKDGQLLHAYKLTFIHPITKKEISVEAPIPDYFENIINLLR